MTGLEPYMNLTVQDLLAVADPKLLTTVIKSFQVIFGASVYAVFS